MLHRNRCLGLAGLPLGAATRLAAEALGANVVATAPALERWEARRQLGDSRAANGTNRSDRSSAVTPYSQPIITVLPP